MGCILINNYFKLILSDSQHQFYEKSAEIANRAFVPQEGEVPLKWITADRERLYAPQRPER
jgi:hypothetical protein